jgi:hypothetical protein
MADTRHREPLCRLTFLPTRRSKLRCASALLLAGSAACAQAQDLRTRAETTAYVETSTYEDVMRVAKGIVSGSRSARYESFGESEEGRELPLLILSEPAVASPAAARELGRPIVLVQANIHAGEVEGKEASLILARRLTSGDLRPLLERVVVLIAPNYNVDGNDKISVMNRTEQNGPVAGVGTRENSQGLDLNRDYMKLDTAEARAFVGFLNRWDPHVVVDLHTTNGSYHGFHLTYSPPLNPNADPRLIALARERVLPAVQQALAAKHGFRTYYYGNFSPEAGAGERPRVDPAEPGDTVWRTFDHRPRFGNNYVGLRNRLAILSEAYSYLDFERRVRVTEVFVEEVLSTTAANAALITALTAALDAETSATRGDLGVAFRNTALPAEVDILVGDIDKRLNPRSGREMLVMSGDSVPVRMKDYGTFEATRTLPMPDGWVIPKWAVDSGSYAAALERLRWHGLTLRPTGGDARIEVERFVVRSLTKAERPFQGRREATLTGTYETVTLSLPGGSLFVPAAQPLARLAFYLLEPQSDDGLATWNLIEQGLAPGEIYPVYRVLSAAALR